MKIYESQKNVLVRVALGNVEAYEEFSNEYLEKDFQEAVLVASENLYNAYHKKGESEEQVMRAILKYKIRNASRCTPYGLFSGVGMLESSAKTSFEIHDEMIKKRARIDMKWLFQYISILLHDENVLSNLKLMFNGSCYVCGNRVINPNFNSNGNREEQKESTYSIRYTRVIEFTMITSQKPIKYVDLIRKICDRFNASFERVKRYVNELIEYGFFIAEILPPMINTNALDYVIKIMDEELSENSHSVFLRELKQKIRAYNCTPIGEGISLYKNIVNDMKNLLESRAYLQVDTKIDCSSQTISEKIGMELEKTINFLAHLSVGYQEQEYIIQYKKDFLEKYGYNTEVLILEMLDNNIGIGIPANYKNSQRKYIDYGLKNEVLNAVNYILCNKALTALGNNKSVIYLTDEDIESINKADLKYENLLNSVDILIQPLASSIENIDNGEFNLLLSGCISSAGAFNLSGRFSDLFWENKKYDCASVQHNQKLMGEDYIEAELVEIFGTGRTANVGMNTNSLSYQICIGCNPSQEKINIELNDIYIGVDRRTNQFYAKSKKMNKRIYAKTTNMLNNFFGSAAYRFLRDISSLATKFQFGECVASLGNPEWKHFPRIMYGKTILRPERWTYRNMREKNFEVWDDNFRNWLRENKVPDYVDYIIGDQYLRLDLRKKEYRELLYYDSLNENTIILREDFVSKNTVWLKDEKDKKHCCEMVFSFNRKSDRDSEKFKIEKYASEKPYYFSTNHRTLFPGEDGWYYYKLYGMKGREDEFIGIDLKEIVYKMLRNGIIDNHFFIRYSDNRYHTRVRFHVCKGQDSEFNKEFNAWLLEEKAKGIITDLSAAVYEREIERYGGKNLIYFAEDVFGKESLLVEKIKEKYYFGEIKVSEEEIAVWSIWGIVQSFNLSLEKAEQWFSKCISKSEYRDVFKKNEKNYRECLRMSLNIDTEIKELYEARNAAIKTFYSEILKTKEANLLTNTVDDILSTIIHMFCNRYVANINWEKKVRALTRHTLYAEESFRRFCNK